MSYKRNKDSEQIVPKLTGEDKNAAMVEIHQASKRSYRNFWIPPILRCASASAVPI
jgi:hypothetical protein